MIELRPMQQDEFEEYILTSVPDYARDKMKSEGLSESAAMQLALDSYQKLLPLGVSTPDHFLFTVIEKTSSEQVGILWFHKRKDGKRAFVYDIALNESSRGKGYGKQTMTLLENEVRLLGIPEIGLHVFAHNKVARNLYEKLGYEPTDLTLVKSLI